ncbi:hypothetical protein ABBQ38_014104 [Trebouxia sp. C0009 RCD-2024]
MLQEQPLVISLSSSSWRLQCRRCLTVFLSRLKATYPCSRCHTAHYCSIYCLEKDTKAHNLSGECLLMQSNQSRSCAVRPFMREACLAARLLHQPSMQPPLQSNQDLLLDGHGPSGEEAEDLMTMAAAVAAARAQAAADATGAAVEEADIASALTAVCQVATNALEVMPVLLGQSASGLHAGPAGMGIPLAVYRLTSRLNHSCCPNAAYFFKPDGTVVVRSMRAIQPGEAVTISYTDLLQTLDERQHNLLHRYAFTCCCERCLDDSPTPGDWFLDAVAADDLEAATQLSEQVQQLLQKGTNLLLEEGSVATAICILEPGLFQLVSSGVHPLHHTCLDIYTCLASAWRLHARGHKQSPRLAAVAHARAALYTVLLAHGLRQLLNTGVHGILPHHARQLSDAAASICKCLKHALEAHPGLPSDVGCAQPPHKRMKLMAQSGPDAEAQQPGRPESTGEQHRRPDHTASNSQQQPPVATTNQHQQQTTQVLVSAGPHLAQEAQSVTISHQQQQQLPEQLLQQMTKPEHLPQRLLQQINAPLHQHDQQQPQHHQTPQHGKQQQQQHEQHPQQHAQQQQGQPPRHDAEPHADHTSKFELHKAGSTPCLLHGGPLQGTSSLPAAAAAAAAAAPSSAVCLQHERVSQGKPDSQEKLVSQGGVIEEGVAAEQRQPGGGGQEGTQTTDGVWKVLLRAAVCHDQELCQELTGECRQEDSDVAPDSCELAGREQFEELASMANLGLSDWPLAGLEILQPAIARQAHQQQLSLRQSSQLLFLAAAAAVCLSEASVALHVAFGNCHQLSEVNSFLPFSSHLPFELASAVTQAASAITISNCE